MADHPDGDPAGLQEEGFPASSSPGASCPRSSPWAGCTSPSGSRTSKALVKSNQNLIKIDPGYFKSFLVNPGFLFHDHHRPRRSAAAGLVADDLKHSSLQLYFSRPLTKKDYLLGKLSVIAFFVLVLTAVPWLVLVVFKLIFAGSLKFLAAYPWLPLSILGYAALLAVFFGFYFLLLSASSRNGATSPSSSSRPISSPTSSPASSAASSGPRTWPCSRSRPTSCRPALSSSAEAALSRILVYWSFAVLAAIAVLALVVLDRRIRGVEVIEVTAVIAAAQPLQVVRQRPRPERRQPGDRAAASPACWARTAPASRPS
ncbi:MAG: ABC transporter permease subunit [Candidatus Moduliflexus flocculans]|nr:ABC transporter permease subunit [Candidatus Moduliflexus flocculans]